jgi:hypothetical protein
MNTTSTSSLWQGPLPYLALWTLVNLLQSAFTGLFHDEAFYWLCGQHLDWGGWYHPPASPFFIHMGWLLLGGELGVRLFMVLLSTSTLYLLYLLARPKRPELFFGLAFSMFLMNVGGFMAAPDIPLVFFAALFLYLLHEYLKEDRWVLALGLGLVVAGMAYSKYHGAIFLLFALLPNWRLLARPSWWLIPVLASLLFLPHLWWQYELGFPTFQYHLIDRDGDPFSYAYLPSYLAGQLLVMGPLVSFILFPAAWRYRSGDAFEKTLQWILWGVLAFFLYQSITKRTEANWTATAALPLLILGYRYVEQNLRWHKVSRWLIAISLVLIGIFRLYLAWDFLPEGVNPRNEFHGWDRWAADIEAIAEERPVVFYNSYRGPSKYSFYTGKTAHSIAIHAYAGNQYDLLWEEEAALQGKEVMLISSTLSDGIEFEPGGVQRNRYRIVPEFYSFNRVRIESLAEQEHKAEAGSTFTLPIRISNPTSDTIRFEAGGQTIQLRYQVFQGDERITTGEALAIWPLSSLAPGAEHQTLATIKTPDVPGTYRYRYGLQVGNQPVGRNGNFKRLIVD